MLLLTNGDWNLGKSPITPATALAQRDVPVFTIGVGSETYLAGPRIAERARADLRTAE